MSKISIYILLFFTTSIYCQYSKSEEIVCNKIKHINSIVDLNKEKEIINSHSEDWKNSILELDYRRYVDLTDIQLDISSVNYPRIKKMADGSYILFYQTNKLGMNVLYTTSKDLINWERPKILFEKIALKDGSDTCYFTTCDAVILKNGNILSFTSFRSINGYKSDPSNNGIIMRQSVDNGKTWDKGKIVYKGTNWEPYALQLSSGEIQVYFTDNNPIKGNSGTSLLRSYDNGVSWKYDAKIIYQKSGTAIDGSRESIYTDQMASARELNISKHIAVALESRFNKEYYLTLAYSADNWEKSLKQGSQQPKYRQSNIQEGCGPYLVQFPSGETVLSYNFNRQFYLQIGDSSACKFNKSMIAFKGLGYWGCIEIANDHTLVAAMPSIYSDNVSKPNSLQIGQFVLNHRINAPKESICVDGDSKDWSNNTDAFFLGSKSYSQAAFRFASDSTNVYLLIERLDMNLTKDDIFSVHLYNPEKKGLLFNFNLKPDVKSRTISTNNNLITCKSMIYGDMKNDNLDEGYVCEISIPKSIIGLEENKLLFNASLFENGTENTFNGLTLENFSKWLPVIFK